MYDSFIGFLILVDIFIWAWFLYEADSIWCNHIIRKTDKEKEMESKVFYEELVMPPNISLTDKEISALTKAIDKGGSTWLIINKNLGTILD